MSQETLGHMCQLAEFSLRPGADEKSYNSPITIDSLWNGKW